MWRPFLVAGRFLTRLPWPDPGPVADADAGRAVLFYPLLGLVVGAAIWLLAILLQGAPAGVSAALVLALWAWLTGALHLDGLGDSVDGWIGGLGSRERTLEIMRDPRAGAMGVVAIVLLLLCKWTAMTALIASAQAGMLIWIPMLARTQLLVLILTTPYARPGGLASAAVAHMPRAGAWVVTTITLVAVASWVGAAALGLFAATLAIFALWRRSWMQRIGGFTGDTAGALVELTETAALLALVLVRE